MSVIGTARVFWNAAGVSSPGTFVAIFWPGLKPSLRFHSSGRIGLPAMLRGIASGFRFEPAARVGGRVGDGEVVVRPRLQADRGVERVASLLAGRGLRGHG